MYQVSYTQFQQFHLIFHTSAKGFLFLCPCRGRGNGGTEGLDKFLKATGQLMAEQRGTFGLSDFEIDDSYFALCLRSLPHLPPCKRINTWSPWALLAVSGELKLTFGAAIQVNHSAIAQQSSLTFTAGRQKFASFGTADPNPEPGVISQSFITPVCLGRQNTPRTVSLPSGAAYRCQH